MSDLIRLSDVLSKAYPASDYNPETFEEIEYEVIDADDVRRIPAVDAVEVVHGYWVNGHESRWQNVSDTYTCSVCGEPATKAFGTSVKSRYCPWCGARMDGQRREDGDT